MIKKLGNNCQRNEEKTLFSHNVLLLLFCFLLDRALLDFIMEEPENLDFHEFWIFGTHGNLCGFGYTKLIERYKNYRQAGRKRLSPRRSGMGGGEVKRFSNWFVSAARICLKASWGYSVQFEPLACRFAFGRDRKP